MPAMADDRSDAPASSDPGITQRTAEAYHVDLIAELEADNRRLRERTDTLQRWLNERTSELRAFGAAAQAVQAARRVVHQPSLLARVPGAAMRVISGARPAASEPAATAATAPPAARLGAPSRISLPRDVAGLTIALVADEPLALALAPECTTIRIRPDDWQAVLVQRRPDMLLVESAWRATAGAWQYRVAWYGHPLAIGLDDLRMLTGWCASNGIPSVFWDTAGPVAEGRFDEAASLFDVILAADPANIAHYDALPTRRATVVDSLAPGIQFRHHHPGRRATSGTPAGPRIVFVGAYDRSRPLADREALDRLLAAGQERGLAIHDTAGIAGPDSAGFPARFQSAIAPFVGTAQLPGVLRAADLILVDAPGGDARGIPVAALEALACGTPVVTTPNRALLERFGDLLPGASPADDPARGIEAILADPAAARGRLEREVLPGLARTDGIGARLVRIAQAAGLSVLPGRPSIAVAVLLDRSDRGPEVAAALVGLADATEFLVGTADWAGSGSALAAELRASRPGVPVRLIEQASELAAGPRLERLAGASTADWFGAWFDRPSEDGRSAAAAAAASSDPLEPLVVATTYADRDRVRGDDPRLPLLVRRISVASGDWPAR
jgi:glycosyltransferase involved in cell wall biosynthesis